jgi:hypothetical protein
VAVLALVGVAVLALAAWGTSVVLGDAQQARGSDEALCAEYATLMGLLAEPGAFATQATNRSARRLSSLADDSPSPDVAAAGSTIRTVIGSVAWERSDLVAATRPVALSCSWRWPVGSTPPAATPRPPAT